MATRLYIDTTNMAPELVAEVIEACAQVPVGTYARYIETMKPFAADRRQINLEFQDTTSERLRNVLRREFEAVSEREYMTISADEDLAKVREFTLYGFGRLNVQTFNFLAYLQRDTDCGAAKDLATIRELISRQIGLPAYNNLPRPVQNAIRQHGLTWS